jgi:negative regulator of sigma E activity
MSRINEQDELLLNRLLDGDLPAADSAVVRQRLEREPELRSVWERLNRIDALLRNRRAATCEIDWGRFHASVVNELVSEAVPVARVIRFPWWARVAVPLAAAAAVALVVVLKAPHAPVKPGTSGPGVLRVAYHAPAAATPSVPGAMVVRFHRPGSSAMADQSAAPYVAFTRSSQLEEQIRAADTARENHASSHLYIMHAEGRSSAAEAPMDLPPL